MNRTQAKVCLFIVIFKFKVTLLDRVTQTVQTRLRSDRDYNTTIGSIRGYTDIGVYYDANLPKRAIIREVRCALNH